MISIRSILLLILMAQICGAELTLHFLNPWKEHFSSKSELYILGNNEVSYYPGTKMIYEGDGWYYYVYKRSISNGDRVEFRYKTLSVEDGVEREYFFPADTTEILLSSIIEKDIHCKEFWIVLSGSSGKYKIYTKAPTDISFHIKLPIKKLSIENLLANWMTIAESKSIVF